MKKMTCRELYGACEMEFQADSPGEMMQKSAAHGMDMKEDPAHKAKMEEMKAIKGTEDEQKFFEDFKKKFEAAPEA